jgi:L-amino acid N-acyltransferase YncA
MSEPQIRAAVSADLPAITEIYREAVLHGTATFELIPPDLAEMTRRFEALTVDGFPYLVAAQHGRVLGYAYVTLFRPRPAYRFTVENSIYLDVAAQRQGIGSRLLARLIAECETRPYRQIIAVIGDSENSGSISLHRNAGFNMIGVHPDVGFKFGRWLDTVMMQLPVNGGGETVPGDDAA